MGEYECLEEEISNQTAVLVRNIVGPRVPSFFSFEGSTWRCAEKRGSGIMCQPNNWPVLHTTTNSYFVCGFTRIILSCDWHGLVAALTLLMQGVERATYGELSTRYLFGFTVYKKAKFNSKVTYHVLHSFASL